MDEIQQEFEELLKQGEGEPAAPEAAQAKADEIAYYLGDKQNKLPVNAELEFTEGGKPIRQNLSTILNHYRQRSELDKKYGEFKKERESWESEAGDRETYSQMRQKYEAIQKWSEENPQDFEYIWGLLENKDKTLAERDGIPPRVAEMLQQQNKELEELKGFKKSFDMEQEEKKDKAAFEETTAEMNEFKANYPEINLDEVGEQGMPLFKEILKHGVSQGISNFRLAAFDLLGPKLQDALIARGRQEAVKAVRQDKQQGVVSRSQTPGTGQSDPDTSKLSWSDLSKAAKGELEQILGKT